MRFAATERAVAAVALALTVGAGSNTSLNSGAPPAAVVRIGTMTVDRATHQATLLRTGTVLVTGGCAGTGCERILASTERYDPRTRTFAAAAPMTLPRASHTATQLLDGRVLVAGGWTGTSATAAAEIYDPNTDHWTVAGNMTEARASQIAVLLRDGRVLMMGGGSGGLGDLGSAEVFDPASATFSAVGRMHANHYLATALADGRVLVTGGQDAQGRIVGTAELFDPTTNTFSPTGNMMVPRVKHAAVLLPDGRVLVAGGSDARGYDARFMSTEFYDPRTGRFSRGPDMQWARHKLRDAVAMLPSGAVVVAGGATRVEVFDPRRGAFLAVPGRLSGPQMFATATLLPDGGVLVLGGYDHRSRSSAAAWMVSGLH